MSVAHSPSVSKHGTCTTVEKNCAPAAEPMRIRLLPDEESAAAGACMLPCARSAYVASRNVALQHTHGAPFPFPFVTVPFVTVLLYRGCILVLSREVSEAANKTIATSSFIT